MKKLMISLVLLLLAVYSEAKFALPQGAEVVGAGSTLAAAYMKALIAKYNTIFPCPKFIYKQTPAAVFAGSDNGIARVIDGSVVFAVADAPIMNAPECFLEIPFILSSLSIIYNLPADFGLGKAFKPNTSWPGHLNISPFDLCTIYTGNGLFSWNGFLGQSYNGSQGYTGTLANTSVQAFARSDSAYETELFVDYLECVGGGICGTFLSAPNVAANHRGPFCNTGAPGQWRTAFTPVICVQGSAAVAQAVASTPGSIGYVDTALACAYGFELSSPPLGGIPMGIMGLFIPGSVVFTPPQANATENPANYTQPTIAAVQAAAPNCIAGEYLCQTGAYPIVVGEEFALYATQSDNLIACNIAQFIQFALTQGQKICGATPLLSTCIAAGLAQLDQIQSAICDPCNEPCNPCLNQICPLPSCLPCKE